MDVIKKKIENIEANNYLIFISFFFLALILYIPSITNPNFFWDDEKFVYLNPKFMNSPSWTYFWNIKSDMFKVWPFGYTVFWAVIQIFPLKSLVVFKIINIFIHSLNAFLIHRLFKKIDIPYSYLLSLLCLIHPLNVESVSWMFQLLTILSFTFFICSFQLILSYLEKPQIIFITLAWLSFALSLLTKGIALLAPFFFLSIFIGKGVRLKAVCLIPFFALSLFLGLLTQKGTEDLSKLSYSPPTAFINDFFELSKKDITKIENHVVNENYTNFIFAIDKKPDIITFNQFEIFSQALIHYPLKLIIPYPLHFLYKSQMVHIGFVSLILIAVIFFVFYFYKETKDKNIFFLSIYSAVFLLPYMGITFITFFYWSNVSDRYTYYIIPAFALLLGLIFKYWDKPFYKKALSFYICTLIILCVNHSLIFNNLFELYKDTFDQKKHPVTYSLLFEQYYYKLDLKNSENILEEGINKFPQDPLLKNDLIRLESLRRFYNQK